MTTHIHSDMIQGNDPRVGWTTSFLVEAPVTHGQNRRSTYSTVCQVQCSLRRSGQRRTRSCCCCSGIAHHGQGACRARQSRTRHCFSTLLSVPSQVLEVSGESKPRSCKTMSKSEIAKGGSVRDATRHASQSRSMACAPLGVADHSSKPTVRRE